MRTRAHPVVTGYGGPDSSGAIELGVLLAGPLHRPLALASAYRYEPVGLSARALPRPSNAVRFDAAQAQLDRAKRLVPTGIEIQEHVVPAGDIAEALADLARDVDACALVLGRDLAGDVTRSVLQHAPCPVAVSPLSVPVPQDDPLRVIGVAYDASPAARFATTAAMHLAVLSGARVELIAAGTAGDRAAVMDEADAARAQLSQAVETCIRVVTGPPGPALVDCSDGLDLLLCGSHGRGRALAAVLGSVSGHLVRAAHCPVLVIPPRTRHRAGTPLGLTTAGG